MKGLFMVELKGGHVGKGRHLEFTRYLEAEDAITAMVIAENMPRVKKGNKNSSVLSVRQIGIEDYLVGLQIEQRNPYLMKISRNSKKCS